jgi:hypothetical protein
LIVSVLIHLLHFLEKPVTALLATWVMAAHAHLSINVLTIPMTAKTSVPVVTPMPILQIMITTVQGYSGNGLTFLAINYCTEDTHGCSDVCNVTGPGTFDCLCTDPLATLSGKTCMSKWQWLQLHW